MNRGILSGSVLAVALVVLGAACNQTTDGNANSAINRNAARTNANSSSPQMPMNDNSKMSGMSDMKSSPNAASAPYDLQFLDTMSAHHTDATKMAKIAVQKSSRPELKAFAQKIIDDQNREIAQMKDWREKWYAGKPEAMNMEMPGMTDSMDMMSGNEMKHLEEATGKDFDLDFLDMMSQHHAGAVVMAKEALTKAEHPEIKTLANQIIKEQESEIKQMAEWKTKWSK